MTSTELVPVAAAAVGGALADLQRPVRPGNMLRPLTRYAPPDASGALAPDIVSLSHLATVSAGEMVGDHPAPARDGRIRLHDEAGRAPALREVLEQRHWLSLVIGFAWNPTVRPDGSLDCSRFVSQRVAAYTRGSLRIAGDERGLTTWESGEARRLEAGTPEFDRAWRQCAPETWVYFHLAAVDPVEGPMLVFPDNSVVPYRLRFGSTNSRRELDACLQMLVGLGQVAFMPILLRIDPKRPVVKPDGKRGQAPVWTFAPLLAPEGTTNVTVSSRRLLAMRGLAREQSQLIAVPEVDPLAMRESLALEAEPIGEDDDDVSQEALERAARAPRCDARRWNRLFHRVASGTPAATDDVRHRFVAWHTARHPDGPQTDSLAAFLEQASEQQAAELVDALLDVIERTRGADGEVDEGAASDPPAPPHGGQAAPATAPDPPTPDGGTGVDLMLDVEDDDQDLPYDEDDEDDVALVDDWLRGLHRRMADHPEALVPASKARFRAAGAALAAAAGDPKAAQRLGETLTGVADVRELSEGACQVLIQEAAGDDWADNVARLRRTVPF